GHVTGVQTCALPISTVHDGQHPNHPPGGHAITHQIHRPTFIRPRGGWASYRAPPADPPPLPNPHRPTFLAVEPVHALVVGRHSFPHQHRRQPPIPETHALRRSLAVRCPAPLFAPDSD